MKKRKVNQALGIMLAACLELSGLAGMFPEVTVYANEMAEAETENRETETGIAEETESMPDVELEADGRMVVLKNETGIAVTQAFLEKVTETEDQRTEEETGGEDSAEEETAGNLVLVDGDGKRHVLEGVDLLAMTDLILTAEKGVFCLSYTDESMETHTIDETVEEEHPEEPETGDMEDPADIREEAEKAAAAAQAAAGSGSSGEKTEVSRQKYDDCDGSGHGYYEIIYSDGSTEIEEY